MRRRIIALTVMIAVLATLVFGLPLGAAVFWYFRVTTTSELERAADGVMLIAAHPLEGGRAPQIPPDEVAGAAVGVYDSSGRLLGGHGPAAADAVVREAGTGRTDMAEGTVGDETVLAVPVMSGAEVAGVVRAAVPRATLIKQVGLAWALMAGLGVAAVVAGWVLARRLTSRLTRPLDQLADAAVRLGDGDFSARAPEAGVAEIDQAGAALNVTAARLGDTLDRERAFSAEVSHQLRTPLAGLRLQLEAAIETPSRDPYEALRAGLGSAERLESIIEDLVSLSREPRAVRAELDLGEVLDELREAGQEMLGARPLRIDVQDPPPVLASAAAVRQVLGVLLDNAVVHGEGAVVVVARDAGGTLAIDISDEGAGPGERDPFVRPWPASVGHGIGLRLARSLAEAEGGRLLLSRKAPPVFTLLLPG